MSNSLERRLIQLRREALKPPPNMTLVEWADSRRYLPGTSALPGRWRTDNVEAAREPMLAVTNPEISEITIKGCTQLLKTEIILNTTGYHIDLDPCALLVMVPNEKLGEAWSKDRFDKMVECTPSLYEKFVAPETGRKQKKKSDTILHKEFIGGSLSIVGSNAPGDLAMRAIKFVMADELNKFAESAGQEGDPLALIRERGATFWDFKMMKVCSPTVEGICRISDEYEQSDQRVFCGTCPRCGELEELKWSNVKWENKDPETAMYFCSYCGEGWTEEDRLQAISKGNGRYKATAPFNGHAGFKVNKLGSPWEPMSELVKKFLKAKDDPQKLKVFINTQLAETWKERTDVPKWRTIYNRREQYLRNTVDKKICLITCGVDVQGDRLEVEITGWGPGMESWLIDYRVLEGKPDDDETWDKLEPIVSETWPVGKDRRMGLRIGCVDANAYTHKVYDFCRRSSVNGILHPIKSIDSLLSSVGARKQMDVNSKGKRIARGIAIFHLGVSFLKGRVYGFLEKDIPTEKELKKDGYPPGYCHFPELDEDYFKQLTAEVKILKNRKYYWVKNRPRNEALDCRVYSMGAACILGVERWKDKHWLAQRSASVSDTSGVVRKKKRTKIKIVGKLN